MRRARPKKKGGIIDAGKAEDLLNVLNSNGGIDEKQLLEILKVEKRPCDHLKAPCKTNRKENVACFCQLVPPETSFRKKGLWVKDQSYLASLGADPSDTKRQVCARAAGVLLSGARGMLIPASVQGCCSDCAYSTVTPFLA